MTWYDAIKIAVAVIGGSGIVIKFSADKIAERLSAKYELRLNKELESFKSGLEKKNYVSKVRFDLEMEIYRDLSKKNFSMVSDIYELYPVKNTLSRDEKEGEKRKRGLLEKATTSYNNANNALMENAPFIPENLFREFEDMRNDCKRQLRTFGVHELGFYKDADVEEKNHDENWAKRFETSGKIWGKRDDLIKKLRTHLERLDVKEK